MFLRKKKFELRNKKMAPKIKRSFYPKGEKVV